MPCSPSTSSSVNRSADATSTPSTEATSSRTPIGMSEKPSSLEIVRSPISVLSIASSIEPLIPAANTVTNETSASPTISAAAVDAVRPGLRTEFSCASRPGTPPSRSSGAPTTVASGVTRIGLSSATPRKTATAPTPTQASPGLRAPEIPSAIAAAPSSPRTAPAAVRRRRSPVVGGTTPSRSPVTGDTRVARSAGARAETTAITTPRTRPMMIVRGSITVPVEGRSMPSAANRLLITFAKPIPSATPTAAAPRPIAAASRMTLARIWRREAPRVRSIANSRVRWATVIENVLKIRKAPTNSATPAKISSAVLMKPVNSPMSSRWDWMFCSPVSTSRSGSAACSEAASRSGETPSSAATEIWSNSPSLPVSRWASGRVSTAIVAPPNESTSPSVAIPLRVYSSVAARPAIVTLSPTAKPSSSADALSITTSSSDIGGLPST